MVICQTPLKKPFLNMLYWCGHIRFFSCKENRLLASLWEITVLMYSEHHLMLV